MQNSKLKKQTEQIQVLEEKLQTALNENAKLKVKQKEDEKLWKGLDSKFYLTKTLCYQLDETFQQLTVQVQNGMCPVQQGMLISVLKIFCRPESKLLQLRKTRPISKINCLKHQFPLINYMSS